MEDRLPMEITQAFTSYDNIIRTAWDTANNTKDEKTKLQALHLIRETRESRIELISNVPIATKVMEMASRKSTEEEQFSTNSALNEEKQKQEQEPIEEQDQEFPEE